MFLFSPCDIICTYDIYVCVSSCSRSGSSCVIRILSVLFQNQYVMFFFFYVRSCWEHSKQWCDTFLYLSICISPLLFYSPFLLLSFPPSIGMVVLQIPPRISKVLIGSFPPSHCSQLVYGSLCLFACLPREYFILISPSFLIQPASNRVNPRYVRSRRSKYEVDLCFHLYYVFANTTWFILIPFAMYVTICGSYFNHTLRWQDQAGSDV